MWKSDENAMDGWHAFGKNFVPVNGPGLPPALCHIEFAFASDGLAHRKLLVHAHIEWWKWAKLLSLK
jgi:hypothetical protein